MITQLRTVVGALFIRALRAAATIFEARDSPKLDANGRTQGDAPTMDEVGWSGGILA